MTYSNNTITRAKRTDEMATVLHGGSIQRASGGFGFGLHVSADHVVLSPTRRERLMRHWDVTQARVNNLYATSRVDPTIAWLRELHHRYPHTRWILRLMPDDGQDAKLSAEAIYARHRPIFEQLPWVTILAGNETGFSDEQKFIAYCENMARLLKLAGDAGHRYAYFRSSMGTPNEAWYRHYRVAFEVNAQYEGGQFHVYSPNEYFASIAPTGEAGLLSRFRRAWDVCTGIPTPATSIGEYGMALNSDPHKSWRTQGSGIQGEREYIESYAGPKYREHYAPYGVTVSLFMYPPDVSPWGESAVGDAGLEAIEALAKAHPDPVPELPAPVDPYREVVAQLRNMGGSASLTVRKAAHTASEKVESIEAGQTIGYIWPPEVGQDIGSERGNLWVRVKVRGVTGYAHAYYLLLPENEPTPVPDPEPQPEPEPEPPTPPDSDTLIVDALTMQYRAFLLRGKIVRRQIELLDEEAQQLQANILQLANLLESLGVSVPEGT